MQKLSFGNLPKVLILKSIFETIFGFAFGSYLNLVLKKKWKKLLSLCPSSFFWPERPSSPFLSFLPANPACSHFLPYSPLPPFRRPNRRRPARTLLLLHGTTQAKARAEERLTSPTHSSGSATVVGRPSHEARATALPSLSVCLTTRPRSFYC